jgi:tetratricopeptide (TPR) repeat protein
VSLLVLALVVSGVWAPTASAQGSPPARYYATLDSAYAARQRGDLDAARALFARAVTADSTQALPRIELAYMALAAGDKPLAVDYLQQAVARDRTRSDIRRQLGFALVELRRNAEAIRAFESIADVPPGLTDRDHLALGYLYDGQARGRAAVGAYKRAAKSTDTSVANPARRSLAAKGDVGTVLFSEGYSALLYQSRFENTIGSVVLRQGIEGGASWAPAAYVALRGTRDSKSALGLQTRILSDNAAVAAAGVRVRPWHGPVWLYAEAGRAFSLLADADPSNESDIRAGAYVIAQDIRRVGTSRVKLVTDVSGDVSWYERFDKNVIGAVQVRHGVRLAERGNRAVDAFIRGWVSYDSKGEFYNRAGELGGGLMIRPHANVSLYAEGLSGRFIDRPPPPTSRRYHDWRITAVLGWRAVKPLHAAEGTR